MCTAAQRLFAANGQVPANRALVALGLIVIAGVALELGRQLRTLEMAEHGRQPVAAGQRGIHPSRRRTALLLIVHVVVDQPLLQMATQGAAALTIVDDPQALHHPLSRRLPHQRPQLRRVARRHSMPHRLLVLILHKAPTLAGKIVTVPLPPLFRWPRHFPSVRTTSYFLSVGTLAVPSSEAHEGVVVGAIAREGRRRPSRGPRRLVGCTINVAGARHTARCLTPAGAAATVPVSHAMST